MSFMKEERRRVTAEFQNRLRPSPRHLDTRMKRLDVNLESNIFSLYRSLNIKDMNYIIKHFVSHQFLLRVIDKNIASENRAVLLNQKEIRLNVGLGNGKSMYSNDGSPSLVTGHNNKHYKPATC